MQKKVFWDVKRPIIPDFLEKGETVNTASYSKKFKQNPPILF